MEVEVSFLAAHSRTRNCYSKLFLRFFVRFNAGKFLGGTPNRWRLPINRRPSGQAPSRLSASAWTPAPSSFVRLPRPMV
jgi:hypothetical protein